MDTEHIVKIIDLMKESDLSEFEIEKEGLKLRICRRMPADAVASYMPTAPQMSIGTEPTKEDAPAEEDPNTVLIKSPMVGTFYLAPAPEKPAFVSVGSKVAPDSTVCIVEAMKVMNEIHAEVSGTVVEILVENGQAVEFGQPLYRVKNN